MGYPGLSSSIWVVPFLVMKCWQAEGPRDLTFTAETLKRGVDAPAEAERFSVEHGVDLMVK